MYYPFFRVGSCPDLDIQWKNILAYMSRARLRKKKVFFDIDTRKLLLEIIAQMALIGYKFHANVNIKVSFDIIAVACLVNILRL